ncbi:hypothetical protein KIV40_00060 [Vibrio sp. D173a]|uniref:hypothetical protein n=1 Tax=Vibrio sp. D173a TaxID=2836349 RepID=UPI002552F7CF|nr:hypothetical protein [Vibrio sp. D173a]MDK9753871.1 hypothetical protein [Vibrio sp. D173a]
MVYEIGFDEDSLGFFVVTKLSKSELTNCIVSVLTIADELIIDSHIETTDICTILVRFFDCNLTYPQDGCEHISEYHLAPGDIDVSSKAELISEYIENNCVTWNNRGTLPSECV